MCQRLRKYLLTAMALCFVLAGCSPGNRAGIPESREGHTTTEVVGSVAHGLQNPLKDPDTGENYVVYEGGELRLEYGACVSGLAEKGVGFMIFIDGEPQAYHTEYGTKNSYLHVFYLQDGVDSGFTFYLNPTAGKRGDALRLCIASVLYPDYKPDMVESKGYGIYHSMLESRYLLKYEEDCPEGHSTAPGTGPTASLELRETGSAENGSDEIKPRLSLYMEDTDITLGNSYATEGKASLHLRLEAAGLGDAEYRCVPYLDHVPLFPEREELPRIRLQPDKVTIMEGDLDISMLREPATFYLVLIPCDRAKAEARLEKTKSVLLIP